MTFNEQLEAFYQQEGKEELRLEKTSPHYLEYLTAVKYLEKYLPPQAKILDSCAGSGIYAFHLAQLGHRVTAGDLIQINVDKLNERQRETPLLEQIYLGDAANLDMFGAASFGAVLLMGALYHLPELETRAAALDESLRVLEPGGVFACTYMNRHAVILNNSSGSLENIDEILAYAESGREGVFYASTPEETLALMNSRGLTALAHVALDGLANFLGFTLGLLNKKGAERWRRYHFAVCETPSLLGYSYHNMYIGKKL
jgi:SAM-dependent methyltransferase